jgi:hypothetical protein
MAQLRLDSNDDGSVVCTYTDTFINLMREIPGAIRQCVTESREGITVNGFNQVRSVSCS